MVESLAVCHDAEPIQIAFNAASSLTSCVTFSFLLRLLWTMDEQTINNNLSLSHKNILISFASFILCADFSILH